MYLYVSIRTDAKEMPRYHSQAHLIISPPPKECFDTCVVHGGVDYFGLFFFLFLFLAFFPSLLVFFFPSSFLHIQYHPPIIVLFSTMGLSLQNLGLSLLILVAFSGQAYAFGAGNIASLSRLEGQNWRHGDIEDALLALYMARVAGGKKFGKLDVKRVYFGNWLRDYSQAVDVGTVKYVSAEAIRILLWVLGFMSFG